MSHFFSRFLMVFFRFLKRFGFMENMEDMENIWMFLEQVSTIQWLGAMEGAKDVHIPAKSGAKEL